MDMVVDLFFLIDLPLRFLFGIVDNGNLITSMPAVAKRYLRTTFVLDFLAAIPVSWIEYATIPENVSCRESDQSSGIVKYLRLIRLIRMIRILKVPKRLFPKRWERRMSRILQSLAAHLASAVLFPATGVQRPADPKDCPVLFPSQQTTARPARTRPGAARARRERRADPAHLRRPPRPGPPAPQRDPPHQGPLLGPRPAPRPQATG